MNTASAQNSHPQPGKCTSADPQKDPLQGHKIHKGSEQLQSGHDNPSQGASRREVLVFRHLAFEDLGAWEETFSQLGFRVAYVDMGVDPLDENRVMNAALLIVLGGPIGVHDKELYPFLADEERAIKRRMSQKAPIIGICLGAQLMALAAGGEVKPAGSGLGGSPGAMEIEFSPLNVTEDGAQSPMKTLAGVDVLHWPGDCFSTPPGAVNLANTPGYPNQAFAIGTWALGLQFHPEFDSSAVEKWLIGHTSDLRAHGVDIVSLRRDAANNGQALRSASTVMMTEWLRRAGLVE